MINEKNLDQEDDIIVYWEGGVPPRLREPEEGPRRRIFGISYWFKDGMYYIARIKNRFDEIKFLYGFSTEIPNVPLCAKEVCRKMEKIAKENGLNFSRRVSYNNPVFYILEDRINFDNYRKFESKLKESKKNFDLPLFNSKNNLKIVSIPGWHRI